MTVPAYAPPDRVVELALETAALSPCQSKRGVVAYVPGADGLRVGVIAGVGYNSPPAPFTCPGRARCAGNCGKRCVHAEMRALRAAAGWGWGWVNDGILQGRELDLVHVELASVLQVEVDPDGAVSSRRTGDRIEHSLPALVQLRGAVVACDGPSCWQCAREVLDVGFVAGVWLYELPTVAEANAAGVTRADDPRHAELATWRRYAAEEFHRTTLERCGMVP